MVGYVKHFLLDTACQSTSDLSNQGGCVSLSFIKHSCAGRACSG